MATSSDPEWIKTAGIVASIIVTAVLGWIARKWKVVEVEGAGETRIVAASFKTDHLLGDIKAGVLAADGTNHEVLEELHAIRILLERLDVRTAERRH